jgi:uncharacterized protein YbaR (Trm112 family)
LLLQCLFLTQIPFLFYSLARYNQPVEKKPQNRPILKIVEQAQQEAEVAFKNVSERVSEANKKAQALKDSMQRPYYKISPKAFVPPPGPATAKEIETLIDKRLKPQTRNDKSTDTDIFYSKKDKTLKRHIGPKALEYKFAQGKRHLLFDLLVLTETYTQTETLKDKLSCPSKNAVYKLVEGINTRSRNDLRIDDSLIEGREGFGYRLNPKFKIHKE